MRVQRTILSIFTFLSVILVVFSAFSQEREMQERVLSASILSGEVKKTPDLEITLEQEDVRRIPDTTGHYWNLEDGSSLSFDFLLPSNARNVTAMVTTYSSDNAEKSLRVRWNNRRLLENGQQKVLSVQRQGLGRHTILLPDAETKEETARITWKNAHFELLAFGGNVGIQAVEITYSIPYTSWEFDDVKITLLSPGFDQKVAEGMPLQIRWRGEGSYDEGWVKIEYKDSRQRDWKPVPGTEDGIAFGDEAWDDEEGTFTWEKPEIFSSAEFRISFQKGPSPKQMRELEDKEKQKKLEKLALELLKQKADILLEAKDNLDSRLWQRYDREGYRTTRAKSNELGKAIEEDAPNAPKLDKLVAEVEAGLLRAFGVIYSSVGNNSADAEDILASMERYLDDIMSAAGNTEEILDKYKDMAEEFRKLVDEFFLGPPFPLEKLVQQIKDEAELAKKMRTPKGTVLFDKDVYVRDFRVTSTGKILAAYSQWNSERNGGDTKVYIRDVSANRDLCSFDMERWGSTHFSPNGTYFCLKAEDIYMIWDTATGELKKDKLSHGTPQWSSNDRYVAYLWYGSTRPLPLMLYDFLTGQERFLSSEEGGGICVFSPNGEYVVAKDGTSSKIFETKTGKEIAKLPVDSTDRLVFSTDGERTAVKNGKCLITWETKTGIEIAHLPTNSDNSYDRLFFSPNGKIMASGVMDKPSAQLWNIDDQKLMSTLNCDESSGVNEVKFSPDGQTIALYCYNGSKDGEEFTTENPPWSVWFFDVNSGKRINILKIDAPNVCFAHANIFTNGMVIFPGNRYFLYGYHGCRIYDISTGEQIVTLGPIITLKNEDRDYHTILHISPDGKSVITQREKDERKFLHQWTFDIKSPPEKEFQRQNMLLLLGEVNELDELINEPQIYTTPLIHEIRSEPHAIY